MTRYQILTVPAEGFCVLVLLVRGLLIDSALLLTLQSRVPVCWTRRRGVYLRTALRAKRRLVRLRWLLVVMLLALALRRCRRRWLVRRGR